MTDEHALPDWVERVLPGVGDFTITLEDPDGGTKWSKAAPKIDQKIARVCEPCNTGWMHELEDACIPVLTPLIRLEGAPTTLTIEQQHDLAFWAMKTALMLEFVNGGDRVPREHYQWLYAHRQERRLPPGCVVWLAGYAAGTRLGWSRPKQLILTGTVSGSRRYGYLLTFSIGHFVAQVGYFGSSDDMQIAGPFEVANQVWPILGPQTWPLNGGLYDDAALLWLTNRFDSA